MKSFAFGSLTAGHELHDHKPVKEPDLNSF